MCEAAPPRTKGHLWKNVGFLGEELRFALKFPLPRGLELLWTPLQQSLPIQADEYRSQHNM